MLVSSDLQFLFKFHKILTEVFFHEVEPYQREPLTNRKLLFFELPSYTLQNWYKISEGTTSKLDCFNASS